MKQPNRIVMALGWIGFGLVSALETLIFGPAWSILNVNWLRGKSAEANEALKRNRALLPDETYEQPQHWRN